MPLLIQNRMVAFKVSLECKNQHMRSCETIKDGSGTDRKRSIV